MADPAKIQAYIQKRLAAQPATPSATMAPSNESASANIAEVGAQSMLEALPLANRAEERRYRERVKQIKDHDTRQKVQASADPALDKIRDIRKKAGAAIYAARRAGDNETADKIREALRQATKGEEPNGPLETAKQGGRVLLKVLDAPHHLVRQATTKAFGDNDHGLYDRPISSSEWTENVRKTASAGGVKGALAQGVLAAPRVFGAAIGTPLGALTGGIGALTDIPSVMRGERKGSEVFEDWGKTISDTVRDTTDLGLTIETDPLSFLSVGVTGGAKTAAAATLRGATRAGVHRATAEQLSKTIGELAAREAGQPGVFKAVESAFESALGTQRGSQVAREIFGEAGEFFGRGQLEAHLPMMSGRGKAVAPALGGQDFAIGKAIKRVADPLLERAGGQPLLHPRAGELETVKRTAKAMQETLSREAVDGFRADLARLPQGHGIDAAVREQILDQYFDPSRLGPQLAPNMLDARYGAGAGTYATAVEKFFVDQGNKLMNAGVLDGFAQNPVSEKYVPRFYRSVVQPLEAALDQAARKGGGGPIAKPRKLDFPTELPYAKREKDIAKIVPEYARLSARAQAQAHLEDALVRAYEIKPGIGAGSNLKKTMLHVRGRDVELPADVANVLRGTFDQGLSTMGRALRNAGAESNPAGRAILKVVDAHHAMSSRFKSLVLKTPAYHAVNIVDDTAKMVMAGMKNPLAYLSRARKMMKGQTVNAGGAARTLSEANQHKIGQGAAARFERQGGEAQGRAIERSIADRAGPRSLGGKVKDTAGKVNDWSNRVGDEWENTAKLANWLWRLDAGDSPAIAASRTMETLIDYSNKSKAEQILGWAVPFIRYAWAAPKVAATQAIRNPGAVNALDRGLELFGSREQENEPARYITERGAYAQATDRQKDIFGNLRELAGGSRNKEGLSYGFVPRLTQYDAMTPLLELAEGNPDALALQMGPLMKAGVEMWTEQDLLTKQPLARPNSVFDMFPPEMPYVPASLKASAGENPWLSRYLPPFLASPGVNLAANTALNRVQDGQGPASYLGGSRPYTGRKDPTDTIAQAWMKYVLGQPGYETSPADRINSIASMPEIQRAIQDQQAVKKTEKAERKNRR